MDNWHISAPIASVLPSPLTGEGAGKGEQKSSLHYDGKFMPNVKFVFNFKLSAII
jgi:hypothetical protein